MAFELKVPTVGESITEVQIGEWRKHEGDWADKNEPLVEIETDKATVEIPAPVAGIVSKVLKKQGEKAVIGDIIGYFEERARTDAPQTTPPPASPTKLAAPTAPAHTTPPRDGDTRVMPAAERVLATHGLRSQDVTPTGPGGRLLKEDVERVAAERIEPPVEHPVATTAAVREAATPAPAGPKPSPPVSTTTAVAPTTGPDGRPSRSEKIVPMSLIRRRIAERLVEAQQNAALLTTFNEVDMSAVIALRTEYKESFQKRYGAKLGFMSFFVKATVDALQAFPTINAEVRDNDIVYHNYYDIGIAVGGGKGLVVPVLRDADRLSFAQVEMAIADFGRRASENKLELRELQGGTFTISNGGVYGSLLSTPIINPPQSGILGLHGINDRPIAHEGQVVIRPMMYLALTYDHRLVDGREAVTFLRRIRELIEDPTRLLLEI